MYSEQGNEVNAFDKLILIIRQPYGQLRVKTGLILRTDVQNPLIKNLYQHTTNQQNCNISHIFVCPILNTALYSYP